MIYQGKAITVDKLDNNIARMTFDLQGESINKFNRLTLNELKEAGQLLNQQTGLKGLLVNSAKDFFIVGADITEFGEMFQAQEQEIVDYIGQLNTLFNTIEDLPYPSVTAINGLALGGGLEMCLTTDFRVMDEQAKIGFPEVQLGIIPGYGGTVRTSRLIGADNAIEWIASGKHYKAHDALAVGMVDAVVVPELLEAAALDLLQKAIDGDFDYQKRRKEKTSALKLDDIEGLMAFETGKAFVAQKAGKHYPAPVAAAKTIEKHARLPRDQAIAIESQQVARLATSQTAKNLINLYLTDQATGKKAKALAATSTAVTRAAVLGAGIMGGGIAYQSASTGTPILMKDIAQQGIDAGMSEAAKLLAKRVNRGHLSPEQMAATLNKITPTLSYESINSVDLIVEAVVENPAVKKAVLSEVEDKIGDDVILCSNTSTIAISELATALKRPENFCGMHFFNPVHRMPLVEVIRGEKTGEQAIARTVNYALAMGKKPVVVKDCPGFLVNRILFAYFSAFVSLLNEGGDFVAIDKAAEAFGWPMGPAYLSDVVGLDTGVHAGKIMAEGFPQTMQHDFKTALEVLLEHNRLGEKNAQGFYSYEPDKHGKIKKTYDPSVRELLAPHTAAPKSFEDEEIIDRLMIALCLEAVRCLEQGIADSASDIDIALIFGVGFPAFRGGALRYIENTGIGTFCEKADRYAALGPLYHPTDNLRQLATTNGSLF